MEAKTQEASRRIEERAGNAKRDLIDAINIAESAGLRGYSRTLTRLAAELERFQARVKVNGSAS